MAFGAFLDRSMLKVADVAITAVRNPGIALKMTPSGIGAGVTIIVVIFSLLAAILMKGI